MKQRTLLIVPLVVLFLLGVGGLGAYFIVTPKERGKETKLLQIAETTSSSQEIAQSEGTTSQSEVPTATEPCDTSGWKTYRNEEYSFEFKYPCSFTLHEYYYKGTETKEVEIVFEPLSRFLTYLRINVSPRSIPYEVYHPEASKTKKETVNSIPWDVEIWVKYEGGGARTRGMTYKTCYKGKFYLLVLENDDYHKIFEKVPKELWKDWPFSLTPEGGDLVITLMEKGEEEFVQIFYKILSSFRFIDEATPGG